VPRPLSKGEARFFPDFREHLDPQPVPGPVLPLSFFFPWGHRAPDKPVKVGIFFFFPPLFFPVAAPRYLTFPPLPLRPFARHGLRHFLKADPPEARSIFLE